MISQMHNFSHSSPWNCCLSTGKFSAGDENGRSRKLAAWQCYKQDLYRQPMLLMMLRITPPACSGCDIHILDSEASKPETCGPMEKCKFYLPQVYLALSFGVIPFEIFGVRKLESPGYCVAFFA